MKIKNVSVALLAGAALAFSSCAPAGYGTWSMATNGYNTSVGWTSASYDASGFPIYGYSNGQPVYGYTSSGAAILTLAALTAACYVPQWNPAPWYRGSWKYPAHIHRAPAPPRFPSGHMPAMRPAGGLNAPIHRNPAPVMGGAPGRLPMNNRPMAAPKPSFNRPVAAPKPVNNRPMAAPKPSFNRPAAAPKPVNNRPMAAPKPSFNRPAAAPKPVNNRPMAAPKPSFNRPAAAPKPVNNRPMAAPAPSAPRPNPGANPGAARPAHNGGHAPHRR